MDSTRTLPRPATRSTIPAVPVLSRFGWLVLALAFAAYGFLLARHMGAYAGGSDSSGYMNHARLLGRGHVHIAPRTIPQLAPPDASNWLYSSLGFKPAPDGNGLVPTYPTGLPLSLLVVAQVVGWTHTGNVTLWLYGMLGALLTFAAARTFGLSARAAVIATVIVAGSPLYLFMTLTVMSDVPALVWTTAAVVAAYRSRSNLAWAWAAGAAFAMAVLVRPTDLVALAPVGIALGWSWRRWAAFVAAGLPGAVFFCLHSHAAYGSYFTTGYGELGDFGQNWITPTLRQYGHWLPILFTPVAAAVLGLPALRRRVPLVVGLLGTWVLAFAALYAGYRFTHQTWWYLRFLLPAAPALVIGAVLVLQSVPVRVPRRAATGVACAALVAIVAWDAHWARSLTALDAGAGERVYPETAAWLKQHVPPDAVLAAMQESGALVYDTDFTFFRWDMIDADRFAQITQALTAAHRPLYAVLFPFERDQGALTKHMPAGIWKRVGAVREVTIWKWSPGPDR